MQNSFNRQADTFQCIKRIQSREKNKRTESDKHSN